MSSKICTICGELKEYSEFNKRKSSKKDGMAPECKACTKVSATKYRKTVPGVVSEIYRKQVNRSNKRGMHAPTYTKEEFRLWLVAQPNFTELYTNWLTSGCDTNLKPSVDRKDDYISYTMENIQLMTWKENNLKGYLDKVSGRNNKVSIPIQQFTLDGVLVQKFYSIAEAARVTGAGGTHIANVAKGKAKTAKGFKWEFVLNHINKRINK